MPAPATRADCIRSGVRMNSHRRPDQMLHIHNGDSAAGTAKKSDIPGEHLAWREALVCSPAPGNLAPAEFRQVRAQHLADAYGSNLEKTVQGLPRQEEKLARFSDNAKVGIRFEHELFC